MEDAGVFMFNAATVRQMIVQRMIPD